MTINFKEKGRKTAKQNRISFEPYLKHEYIVNRTASISESPVHHGFDDRDPDMIHHFRISARLEEERRSNYPPKGVV